MIHDSLHTVGQDQQGLTSPGQVSCGRGQSQSITEGWFAVRAVIILLFQGFFATTWNRSIRSTEGYKKI